MLSLKATLKAIAESISTIKTTLDGKATKYTEYGTPVDISGKTSWWTIPSDGLIHIHLRYTSYVSLEIKNEDGSGYHWFPISNAYGANHDSFVVPVFKNQKIVCAYQTGNFSESQRVFIPFV